MSMRLCRSCYRLHLEKVTEAFAPVLPDLEHVLRLALERLPGLQDRARAFLLLVQWWALRRGDGDEQMIGHG
jgi:hypothetical protein